MKKLLLLTTGILLTCLQSIFAQSYDFPPYPQMDFTIEHLTGEVEFDDRDQLRGDVQYRVRFLSEQSDSLMLDAVRMQVDDVLMEERTMDFEVHNDTLVVYLDDTYARNQTASLRILYNTQPVFGVHRTYRETLFASQLPKSTRHWLPTTDHPGTSFTYELTARHPASKQFVMSGRRVSNEVVTVDTEETQYQSDTAIPVSSLFFALGDFESTSRTIGQREIHLYTEQPNSDEIDEDNLIDLARETISRVEELTGREYPYRDLHMVGLHDRFWETRTFGAGSLIFDVSNSQNDQVIYGIAGQWAGVLLREMEWENSEPLQLMHGYFASQTDLQNIEQDTLHPEASLYSALSAGHINRYRTFVENKPDIERTLSAAKEAFFEQGQYPLTWQDYAVIVYRQTGLFPSEKPEFTEPEPAAEQEYVYDVAVGLNDAEDEATISVNAQDVPIEELVTVSAELIGISDTRTREITFSGESDEVVVSLPSGIENIELMIEDREDVRLSVQKPFMFWIYQLQNSKSADSRKRAAAGLRDFTDNPDLQLALLDIIRNEDDAAVKGEILHTLSRVTRGASGTADDFLELAGDDQPVEVREQAVRALEDYEGNNRVINALQSLIASDDPPEIKSLAIRSLAGIADTEQFSGMVESLITREQVLYQVPELLNSLAVSGAAEKAVELSDTFLSAEFPYPVRAGVLRIILENDESQQGWGDRIESLISDRDPRIRYLSVRGLQYVDEENRNRIIRTRQAEEFDERIATLLESL
ncbi:MAG: HEAT repeat domain-containing protein [Balneolaceae bacterium]